MPNRLSTAGKYPKKSLLSSESHKVSPRHVASFMFAGLISIYGSSFLSPCCSIRWSEGTGDGYDDTDFFLDICIGLFGYLPNLEASLLHPLGFIMIQGRVEIVDEFSEVFGCGCKGMLA